MTEAPKEGEAPEEQPTYTVRIYMKSRNVIILRGVTECTWKEDRFSTEFILKQRPDVLGERLLVPTLKLSEVEAVTCQREIA